MKLANNRSDEYLSRVADESLLHQLFIEVHKYFDREAAVTPKPNPTNVDGEWFLGLSLSLSFSQTHNLISVFVFVFVSMQRQHQPLH